jgi:hypothetical protein
MSWSLRQDMPRLRKAVDSAPSIFSQRPWELIAVADDRVELYSVPDPSLARQLPREAVISCGAALYNLKLAIRVAGRHPSVWLLPDTDPESGLLATVGGRRTLLASVEVMGGRAAPPTDAEQELYEALWLRRTDRSPYTSLPVPFPILVEMEVAARNEDGWLRILTRRESRRMRRAAIQASTELGAALSGLNHVPGGAYGPAPQDTREPATRPDLWLPGQSARFERHPRLMTLSTDDDRPLDWLRAGQALQAALLAGTRFSMSAPTGRSAGYKRQLQYGPLDPHLLRPRPAVPAGYAVEASFLTQSLELADLRHQPRAWPWRTNYTEIPQVVMRVGYAPTERVIPPAPLVKAAS